MPVIGLLNPTSPDNTNADRLRAFREGLKEIGYVDGENVAFEYRWADNQLDRLPALAAELVRRQVAVIVATGGSAIALVAKRATTTIPVVFIVNEDPVKLGLVTSLARPSGNLTGINIFNAELTAKRLGFLRELVPGAIRVAVLVNPANAVIAETTLREVEPAARATGLQIQVLNAGNEPRDRCGVRKSCGRAAGRAVRRSRPLLNRAACPIGPPGVVPQAPRNIYDA
jgi:putative ABC transport system substrate-binding protein